MGRVLEGTPWPWTDLVPGIVACGVLAALALADVARTLTRAAVR